MHGTITYGQKNPKVTKRVIHAKIFQNGLREIHHVKIQKPTIQEKKCLRQQCDCAIKEIKSSLQECKNKQHGGC